MKTMFNKIISIFLCVVMACSVGLVNGVCAADGQSDDVIYFADKEENDFCEIKRTTATVTINPLEKVKLFANYRIYSCYDYELVWTIDGKSVFLNGDSDKTTKGNEVELIFLDDTTVKLQIVSSDGAVLCEDEVFLKSYVDKERSFWVRLESWFLTVLIILVGVVGGTVGPWIGSLIK